MAIKAVEILELLRSRHAKDVFVVECKNGPTLTSVHDRMDAWAMRRSWTRPMIWGYEIKVRRGDWIKDTKWRNYLRYCYEFYFVCPPGIIERDELPEEAGLIWTSKTGTRLYTKKRAPTRALTMPEELWMYLLMCRCQIKGNTWDDEHGSGGERDYWKQWLAQKRENRDLGYRVRGELSKTVSERVHEMGHKNRMLEAENKKLAEVRDTMKKLGLTKWDGAWAVEQKHKELLAVVPHTLKGSMDKLEDELKMFRAELKKLDVR